MNLFPSLPSERVLIHRPRLDQQHPASSVTVDIYTQPVRLLHTVMPKLTVGHLVVIELRDEERGQQERRGLAMRDGELPALTPICTSLERLDCQFSRISN